MGKRNKLWLSMQTVTLAGITTLSACSMDSSGEGDQIEGESGNAEQVSTLHAMPDLQGEGGEGEGAATEVDLATDDLAYLTQLGLMRGHLLVGNKLYQEGHAEHAKTHMKHPKSELYADIKPAFSARGAAGFAEQLEDLANKVTADSSLEDVTASYQQLTTAISNSESFVDEASASPAAKLKLAMTLLRVAGEEYAIAVVDGKMENAHEYQDAYGFTQIAKTTVASIDEIDDTVSAAKEKALSLLTELAPLWPSTIPPATLSTEASQIYGAAARIEVLALGLQ
mgnify:CR=1 FL=1